MKQDQFKNWLIAYGRAWEAREPQAVLPLFTQDATYQETPFDEPMRGLPAILDYWSDIPRSQEQIRFEHTLLSVAGDLGIAHWTASFVRIPSGVRVRLDGILTAEFDTQDRCRTFKEWWHRLEVDPSSPAPV